MKKIISLTACLLMVSLSLVLGQQPQPPAGISPRPVPAASESPDLPKFDLDFPGGTPAQLVKAIEDASHRPLNVIINKEDENTHIPPLKMNDVNVAQLFAALTPASYKYVTVNNTSYQTDYSFRTQDRLTENSIWYFHVDKPAGSSSSEQVCRFYSLAPYLDRGLNVDDITTAIQTGWKMEGLQPQTYSFPLLNYHKETKMLIACGDPHLLTTIDSVLQALPQANSNAPKPGEMEAAINKLKNEVISLKATVAALEEKSGK